MRDTESTADPETTIRETIQTLLERRGAGNCEVTRESKLSAELGLDSLELAEISAVLEDEFGTDPYSEGIVPETLAQLLAFYGR